MTQNTDDGNLNDRVRLLEAQLGQLLRSRARNQPNKRDLRDCRKLTKIQDGQTDAYDAATGEWVPTDFPVGDNVAMGFYADAAATLPASGASYFHPVTPSIAIPAGASKVLIVSTVQLNPIVGAGDTAWMRNAHAGADDGLVATRLCNNGGGFQPAVTRASVMSVTPGVSVTLGVFFGDLHVDTDWYGTPFTVTTAYLIS